MKKLISISLVLLLIVSATLLPSCGKKTPYELISEAIANTSEYSSYKAVVNMDMELETMGMKFDSTAVQEMSASGLNTDSPVFRATQTTTAVGNTATVDIYVQNGTYYISASDQKFKIAQDKLEGSEFEDLAINKDKDTLSSVIVSLPETVFKEETVIVDNEDGTQSVELNLTAEEFKQIYGKYISEAFDEDITALELSAGTIKITVENGKAVAIELKVGITMTVEGIAAQVDLDAKFENINKPITPEAPADLDSYTDYSAMISSIAP